MRRKRGARFLAQAWHDIERAGGKARLPRQIGERERGEAGFLRRLQDAGVAHRQRRADGAAGDLHRIIPRHDVAGDAVRLAQSVNGVAVEVGDRLAHDLVGGAAVELHVTRHRQRVGAPLPDRFADVEGLQPGELLDAGPDEIAEPRQEAAAFGRAEPPPVPGERAFGRVDRGVDIGGLPAGNRADLRAARGILERQKLVRLRPHPAPVDEALVDLEPGEAGSHLSSPAERGRGTARRAVEGADASIIAIAIRITASAVSSKFRASSLAGIRTTIMPCASSQSFRRRSRSGLSPKSCAIPSTSMARRAFAQ